MYKTEKTLLKAHLDAVERQLLAISQIPANAGHMLHRGTPREAFIREFLTGHLSAKLSVGTGEIIDANSQPRQPRNQFDIVIYKSEYPKIDLGGGISAFLSESVVATIEVKSLLTAAELDVAVKNAATAKKLQRNLIQSFQAGWVPPGIISLVVAYAGPAQIATVHGWLLNSEKNQGLNQTQLPPNGDMRTGISSESVESIICLGLGSINFDNAPMSLLNDQIRANQPDSKRQVIQSADGNLLWLFLLLTQAASNTTAQWPDLATYLQRVRFQSNFLP
jgi:hypothetical protein